MSGIDHHDAMRIHALRRFHQRTGAVLAVEEYEAMCAAIRRDDPRPVAMTQENLRFYKVRVRGITAFALWKQNAIATFYPSEHWITSRGGRMLSEEAAA